MKLDKLDVLLYFKFFLSATPAEQKPPSVSPTPNAKDSPPHTNERLDVQIDLNDFLEDRSKSEDAAGHPIYIVYNYSRDLQSSDRLMKSSKNKCSRLPGPPRTARWSKDTRRSA